MDGIDPAWFYSSLAQTTAAIVGLMGGLLGGRILDHVAVMRQERNAVEDKVLAVQTTFRNRLSAWEGFRKWLIAEAQEDEATLKKGKATRYTSFVQSWSSSGSGAPFSIECSPHLDSVRRDLASLEIASRAYLPLDGPIDNWTTKPLINRLMEAADSLPEQPAKILTSDADQLRNLTGDITRFRSRALPASFVTVVSILGWLVLAGILWPLSALPGLASPWYSASLLLVGLAIGLVGLLAWYVYQLVELRSLGRFRWGIPS